jgi:hypothetical protein
MVSAPVEGVNDALENTIREGKATTNLHSIVTGSIPDDISGNQHRAVVHGVVCIACCTTQTHHKSDALTGLWLMDYMVQLQLMRFQGSKWGKDGGITYNKARGTIAGKRIAGKIRDDEMI